MVAVKAVQTRNTYVTFDLHIRIRSAARESRVQKDRLLAKEFQFLLCVSSSFVEINQEEVPIPLGLLGRYDIRDAASSPLATFTEWQNCYALAQIQAVTLYGQVANVQKIAESESPSTQILNFGSG